MSSVPIPSHGGQLRHIAAAFNIPASSLLDFSANINPEGPSAAVLAALRGALDDPSTLTAYPDLAQTDLKQSIASYAHVDPQNIAVANGFVPLLEAALRILPIRRCLLPVPAFNEYRFALTRAGIEVIPHALDAATHFPYDPETLLAGQPNAILLANPQNPSGVLHSRDAMLALVELAAQRDIFVLLDEAFIDYAPEHSLCTFTDRFPNLIVFRSVTKFHAIPGLRAAYAVLNAALAASLEDSFAPWPITTLASLGVIAALSDQQYAARAIALNDQRRTALRDSLEDFGLKVYPSAANFLLFRVPAAIDATAIWRNLIADHHVVLRNCANYEALSAGHFRVAVRTEEENRRLLQGLKTESSPLPRKLVKYSIDET